MDYLAALGDPFRWRYITKPSTHFVRFQAFSAQASLVSQTQSA